MTLVYLPDNPKPSAQYPVYFIFNPCMPDNPKPSAQYPVYLIFNPCMPDNPFYPTDLALVKNKQFNLYSFLSPFPGMIEIDCFGPSGERHCLWTQ